jgi:hypothetical protein
MIWFCSCHCGRLAATMESAAADPPLRECQCSFCRMHAALSFSDPAGRVTLLLRRPEMVEPYRFARRTADFLICKVCGAYVAAVMEERFAILNARTLDEPLPGTPQPMVYDAESTEDRVARRRGRWTPVAARLEGSAALQAQLVAMRALDERVRAEQAAAGTLFAGYHPRMEHVHLRNAARLEIILDESGWPGRAAVGDDAAEAAWRIAQHAISWPAFMRRCLPLVKRDGDPVQAAMLEDRILVLEGKPQLHGTQLDWDEQGRMAPLPVDDPAAVAARRRALGLPPLAAPYLPEDEPAPTDLRARSHAQEEWLRRVGWRT